MSLPPLEKSNNDSLNKTSIGFNMRSMKDNYRININSESYNSETKYS